MTPQEANAFIAKLEASGERHPVMVNGKTVMFRRFGSGRPLVLLHGGHGSWQHWVRNIGPLAEKREVWAVDMPGFGDSDVPDAPAGLDELLLLLRLSLDQIFKDETFDLGGFSFGGKVSASIAALDPRVGKLALMGSAGHGGARRETIKLLNWRLYKGETEFLAAMRHNLAAHMISNPARVDGLAMAAHIHSCRMTRFRSKDISRHATLNNLLADRKIPTLMAWGENDITADPAVILPKLLEGHPNRTGKIVPGAGHWVQFEAHETMNRLLMDWLDAPV